MNSAKSARNFLRWSRDDADLTRPEKLDASLHELCFSQVDQNGVVQEAIIKQITILLRQLDNVAKRRPEAAWCPQPRTYAILRRIGGLHFMNDFIKQGWNDFYLPVTDGDLPEFIQDNSDNSYRTNFLHVQNYFLSPTKDIEIRYKDHFRLDDGDSIFYHQSKLGQGGFGSVDLVQSTLSCQYYARKRVFKGSSSKYARQAQRTLQRELKILKRITHEHLVQIIGSYSDRKYIAYIMLPVADTSLDCFLSQNSPLGEKEMAMLRRFYGCLAAGVNHLHRNNIRHNDLTRRNVLIYQEDVYIADFGSCHSWDSWGTLGSRTRHINTGMSPDYMAPEIAMFNSTNKGRAADMWSLGVLFLEITTRLLSRRLEDYQLALSRHARKAHRENHLWAVPGFGSKWMGTLRENGHVVPHGPYDYEPLKWTRSLLQEEPKSRCTSAALMYTIMSSPSFTDFCCFKCKDEFTDEDLVYEHRRVRQDPEDYSQAMLETVDGVFNKDKGTRLNDVRSRKKALFIEGWRDDIPFDCEHPVDDSSSKDIIHADGVDSETESDGDAFSIYSDAKEIQLDEEMPRGSEQLLFGLPNYLSGPQPFPNYYREELGKDEHTRTGNEGFEENDDPRHAKDGVRTDTTYTVHDGSTTGTRPDMEGELVGLENSTALFEEVESTSSNNDLDDTRLFEAISDKSDSSCDIGDEPKPEKRLNTTSAMFDDTDDDNTDDNSQEFKGNKSRVRALSIHGDMFEEEEEVSDSGSNGSSKCPTKSQSGVRIIQEHIENSLQVSGEVWEQPLNDRKRERVQKTRTADCPNASTPRRGKDDQTCEKCQNRNKETLHQSLSRPPEQTAHHDQHPHMGGPEDRFPSQVNPSSDKGTPPMKPGGLHGLDTTNVVVGSSINAGNVTAKLNESLHSRIEGPGASKKCNNEGDQGVLPVISIHPPDDEPVGSNGASKSEEIGMGNAAPDQLSKKNLKSNALKARDVRGAIELLNPAQFLKKAADDASSIATSAISDNSKRSITGISFQATQADKLESVLERFCSKGRPSRVRWLLSEGCNPGTMEDRRAAPIIRAVRGRSKKHIKCVGALIQHGVNLNVVTSSSGRTPLHFAIENPNFDGYEKLIWLLVDQGARVDKKSKAKETPLMTLFSGSSETAFKIHHLRALAILLNAGAKVNCMLPATGESPLHVAVRRKDDWATAMVLHLGADVKCKDATGMTPLHLTANQFRGQLSAEHARVLNIVLKYMVESDSSAIDELDKTSGKTPLHLAISTGTAQAVELLLKYGASPLVKDKDGHDGIYHALASSKKLTADQRRLGDHAEIMERLNIAASCGWPFGQGTCTLKLACNDRSILESLLGRGLDPNTICRGMRNGNANAANRIVQCGAWAAEKKHSVKGRK